MSREIDPRCAIKAHEHATNAKSFAQQRKYEKAAKEHGLSRGYFRDAKKMLQKEDPDTAAALGILSYHQKLKMRDMQKRAKTESNNLKEKESEKAKTEKKVEKESINLNKVAPPSEKKKKSTILTKQSSENDHTSTTKEIKRVLGGFKDLLSMESKMKKLAIEKPKEDDFFVVDPRGKSDSHTSNVASRSSEKEMQLMNRKLKELSKENAELKQTIDEFRSKFAVLKKAMEHFKNAWQNHERDSSK